MKPLLIGLAGRAGAGKDTVGGMIKRCLVQRGQGAMLVSFAGPLKSICQSVYDFSDFQMTDRYAKEVGDVRYPRPDGTYLSPREAMQLLGTEWGRRCYPNTWSDFGLRRAKDFRASNLHVVFTDCRFVSEAKAIRKEDGEVWRIYRASADAVPATHQSETEMDTDAFKELVTRTVDNNEGTLEQLFELVKPWFGSTGAPNRASPTKEP